nr:reverse transcriptase domain-containing protein [Tanacetum cinerariifolium]
MHKEKRLLVDCESRNGVQTNEEINSGIAYVSRTETGRRTNHLPGSYKRSHQCSPNDRKGREANAYILRWPCITRSKNQLQPDVKVDTCSGHDIHYRPRTSVKGQILADFIMERPEDDSHDTPMEDEEALSDPWILFTDGSSCIDGSGASLIITNPEGIEFTYALSFDHLSKQVLVEELKEKSIDEKEVLAVVEEEGRTRMTLIHEYLAKEILPEEKGRPLQANYVLREIHEGSCNMYTSPRSVVAKALRLGNGETPFSLTYGTKAVILVEIDMPTLKTAEVDMIKKDEALVHNTSFNPGDLVYWSNEESHAKDGGKIKPKWEGPYKVTEALGKGAYKLRDYNRNILPRTWNICNLKK